MEGAVSLKEGAALSLLDTVVASGSLLRQEPNNVVEELEAISEQGIASVMGTPKELISKC